MPNHINLLKLGGKKAMKRSKFIQSLLSLPFGAALLVKSFSKLNYETVLLLEEISIAGYSYYEGSECIETLKCGEVLTIQAEPLNEHDKFAIELFYRDIKLGYVPRYENEVLSRLLQSGASLQCKVVEVKPHASDWEKIQVNIYLIQKV